MRWPPDVLAVMRRNRRHDPNDPSWHPQRTTMRTSRWAATTERSPPDYGCVDWYVYEEQRSERESL